MTEMIKLFCDNKIGIDITGMSVTDPRTVELISILERFVVVTPKFYTRTVTEYFKELEKEKWEVLVCDYDNTLNAYRGYTADDWKAKHQTFTIEEFLGKQIDIEENTLMEMFN